MVNIDSDGYYSFQIGRSYTNVRFKKGSDVELSLDADSFFSSIEYFGDLKKVNNYNVSKSKMRSKLVGDTKEYNGGKTGYGKGKYTLFDIGTYELIEKTQSNANDQFKFQHLKEGMYFIAAVQDSLLDIKDDIRKQTESPVSESRLKEIEESELTFNNE